VGTGTDLGVLVGEGDLDGGLLLDAVALQVNRLQDAARQVLLLRRGQLRRQEVEEDGKLLPLGVAVGQHGGQEVVHAAEGLGLALEVHLPVFVERLLVDRHTGVQDGIQTIARSATSLNS